MGGGRRAAGGGGEGCASGEGPARAGPADMGASLRRAAADSSALLQRPSAERNRSCCKRRRPRAAAARRRRHKHSPRPSAPPPLLRFSLPAGAPPPPPPLPSRTKWTRLVHPSVLIGHVSSLSPVLTRSWRPPPPRPALPAPAPPPRTRRRPPAPGRTRPPPWPRAAHARRCGSRAGKPCRAAPRRPAVSAPWYARAARWAPPPPSLPSTNRTHIYPRPRTIRTHIYPPCRCWQQRTRNLGIVTVHAQQENTRTARATRGLLALEGKRNGGGVRTCSRCSQGTRSTRPAGSPGGSWDRTPGPPPRSARPRALSGS